MVELPGYVLKEKVFESHRTKVYRGQRRDNGQPVIIKLMNNAYPSLEEVARFRREFEILQNLAAQGAIKAYSLERHQLSYFMVTEDIGGRSLDQWLKSGGTWEAPMDPGTFLPLAEKSAAALGELHQAQVIHKDINPANIIYNPETQDLKIIDFGCSTFLPQERPVLGNPVVLEGTLLYISPEQTGRMNRPVDCRTDYYSLGATYYHLLTGQPPFVSTDSLELVHSHIARQPLTPSEIKPEIPKAISDIVMKLMEKDADRRYLSIRGLLADLRECEQQWREQGRIDDFPLGKKDVTERLHLPQKLYGREAEVEQLLAAFERTAAGSGELILIAGDSGIGKTALVQELYKPVTRQRGYYIAGKFDQLQRNIPYSAWLQALRSLVRQILVESEVQIRNWRERLLLSLGDNGQIIIEVIPELELIMGPQPAVPELGPLESQIRFGLLFQEFIKVFARIEHPLVVFLDDLQWADGASLKLMETLMGTPYLLIIMAYRDKEVEAAHPLRVTVGMLQKGGAAVETIHPGPLKVADIVQLLAETLHCRSERIEPLAQRVFKKCLGNPFLLLELLKYLYEQRLLTVDHSQGEWVWSLEEIERLRIADRVAALMEEKAHKMPESARRVMQLAASIGNTFNLKTLALVCGKTWRETAKEIWTAVADGLVLPVGDAYKLAMVEGQDTSQMAIEVEYRFAHDRVQYAFYGLIPEAQREAVHLRIGRLLRQTGDKEHQVFDIVNQLNLGRRLIETEPDRVELARLNLGAGKKARDAAAFEAALGYYETGLDLIHGAAWSENGDLELGLHLGAMEAAYLCGQLEKTEKLGETALAKACSLLDRVKVQAVMIQALWAQNKLTESIAAALAVLRELGLELPESPGPEDLGAGIGTIGELLAAKSNQELLELPEMTDPSKLAVMNILLSVAAPAYFAAPLLYLLISLKQIELSVEWGNTPSTAVAYANYALILSAVVGDIDNGTRIGELALALVDRFGAKEFKPIVNHLVNWFVRHWKEPVNTLAPRFLEVYRTGLETGAVVYAAGALGASRIHDYVAGGDLVRLAQEMADGAKTIKKLAQEPALQMNEVFRQVILNLMGEAEDPATLKGEAYDYAIMETRHQQENNRFALCLLHYNQMVLHYLFGENEKAEADSEQTAAYLDGGGGTIFVPLYHFYDSLVQLAACAYLDEAGKEAALARVAANQEKFTNWMAHAPGNHAHKYWLVEGERLRVLGENGPAMDAYDRAVSLAQTNQYPQEEALALELAGRFYTGKGNHRVGRVYLKDAQYAYNHWGGRAKAEELEHRYPEVFEDMAKAEHPLFVHGLHTTTTEHAVSQTLDLASILKASQAISGEIVFDQLLSQLMTVLMENAGAQRGALILAQDDDLKIEAWAEVDKKPVTVLKNEYLEDAGDKLSLAIVHYVVRSRETVVTGRAEQSDYANDPYIVARQPKSILCFPVVSRGKFVGALYLENNLVSDAFTPERVEMLSLLSAQIAISLENSRLFTRLEESRDEITGWNQQLERKVKERTTDLIQAFEQLKELDHLKTDFLSMVSHELRTPITSIIGFASLIRRRLQELGGVMVETENGRQVTASQQIQQYVDIIQTESERLTNLINDLLDISQLESGKMEWRIEKVDFGELIEKAGTAVGSLLEQKNLAFISEIEPDLPVVLGDSERLMQVLINLLSNAVKFTDQGAITCRAFQCENGITVQVADTGVGIESHNYEEIFERFKQISGEKRGRPKGTGLGLPICKQIVEYHGGRIWVESEPGKGTVFSFFLPERQDNPRVFRT